MFSYRRATSFLATFVLLGFSCGEVRQRVSTPLSRRGVEQGSRDERAGPVAAARHHINAELLVKRRHSAELLSHASPNQHHRRAQSSCAESSPIEITSSYYPDGEGCYFQTEVDVSDGFVEIIYTPSGEPEVGQLWMHPDGVITETGTLPGVGTRMPSLHRVLSPLLFKAPGCIRTTNDRRERSIFQRR